MTLPIQLIYAGLFGVLVALIVATAQQNWKPKVFFLLALRLAIGWQFLFEGLNKIQSHYVGASENNRVFTSEPYFKEAPGPLASYMRAMNGDPAKLIADKLTPKKDVTAADFAKLGMDEQAGLCPDAVAKELENTIHDDAEQTLKALPKRYEAALKAIDDAEKFQTATATTDQVRAAAKETADAAREKAKQQNEEAKQKAEQRLKDAQELNKELVTAAKATYARWVYGVDRREVKMARIGGDPVLMTVAQRQHLLGLLKQEKDEAESRLREGLGGGYGIDVKKAQSSRGDYWNGQADLVKDADSFVTELKTAINDGKAPEKGTDLTPLQKNDWLTRWFLTAVGAGLLFGLFTRLSCIGAAGFLLLTYLTHPPFPWFTLPPGTEGNPLFINKNAVEFFALVALACLPTGRWLGLDALISYLVWGPSKPRAAELNPQPIPPKA